MPHGRHTSAVALAACSTRSVWRVGSLRNNAFEARLAQRLAHNQTVNYETSPINEWMTTKDPFGYALPGGLWAAIGLAILASIVLRKTVFGRHVFALGSNEATARLCGIATRKLKIIVYVVAGCFFGLAGLFVSELNQKRRLMTQHLHEREEQIKLRRDAEQRIRRGGRHRTCSNPSLHPSPQPAGSPRGRALAPLSDRPPHRASLDS